MVKEFSGSHKIIAMDKASFFPQKSIISPQMTWKTLLRIEKQDSTLCLFYRIPHKRLSKGKGILKITKVKSTENCENVLERKPEIKVSKLSHLKLYFTSKRERNLKLKTEFKAFHFYFSVSRQDEKDLVLELPLYNTVTSNLKNPNKLQYKTKNFEKYDEPWRETLAPGMRVYTGDIKLGRPVVIDGDVWLNYAENNYKFCYRVDRSCKILQDFECGTCKRGWYSVVDHACKNGGSKLCGSSRCGERNQPACPRGTGFEEPQNGSYCFRGSKAGICRDGLETYCDENEVLICK
tara:strand:- start:16664 stop:17542 length:879 start_codon:yes stop_codon:yes gene_type:complete